MKNYLRTISITIIAGAMLVVASACGSSPSTSVPADTNTPAAQVEANPTAAQMDAQPTEAAAASSDTSGGAVKLDTYKLLKDNGSGAAGDEVQSFTPADHVQYFDAQLTGFLKVGSTVNWVFTAVDTTAGKDIKITEVNTKVLVANHLNANLSLDKDFPAGKYKADITVDGTPVGTIEYTVAG